MEWHRSMALGPSTRHSGMRREAQTLKLEIPASMREPVIGPRIARTRWHRPGMTS